MEEIEAGVGGGKLVFGAGGLNLLLLGLAPGLVVGGFLLGVLISGTSESSESVEQLAESESEPDSLPSLSSLLESSSSSLLLSSLLLLSLSEATSASSLR